MHGGGMVLCILPTVAADARVRSLGSVPSCCLPMGSGSPPTPATARRTVGRAVPGPPESGVPVRGVHGTGKHEAFKCQPPHEHQHSASAQQGSHLVASQTRADLRRHRLGHLPVAPLRKTLHPELHSPRPRPRLPPLHPLVAAADSQGPWLGLVAARASAAAPAEARAPVGTNRR